MSRTIAEFALTLLLVAMAGCHRPNSSAEELSKHVEDQLTSGFLLDAEKSAADGFGRFSSDPYWSDRFRVKLAQVFLYQGESRRAEQLLIGIPINPDPDTEARRLLILAIAELRLGNSKSMNKAVKDASALIQAGVLHGELLAVEGSVALANGDLNSAQRFFEGAFNEDVAQQATFSSVQVILNLGVVLLHQQRYGEALARFHQASDLAAKIGAHQYIEKAEGNAGRVYYQIGDYARAREHAAAAANQAQKLGARFDSVYWITNAGLSEFAEGSYIAAQKSFEKALALSKIINNPELALHAEVAISYLLLKQGLGQASTHIDEAGRLADLGSDRTDDMEPLLLQALLAIERKKTSDAESYLKQIIRQSNTSPSLQWEATNTLAGLYEKTNRPRLAEQWYQRAIYTFHRQRLTLKSVELELPFLENGSDIYMGYMEHLIRAGRTGEALRLLDTSRAETLAEGLGVEAKRPGKEVDPRAVAARLHATILVYCLRPERSYLWAITGRRREFHALPGSGAILPLLKKHNNEILASKDLLTQNDSTGRALYDALLAPAAGLLPKDGGRVVLVADSALSKLNFETLIAPGETPRYWIEDASVTNARSLRLLAASTQPGHAKANTGPKMLLIGDPVYAKGEYAPLPNAGAEMAGIAAHFAPAERVVAKGRDASPEAYAGSKPGRFRFAHFVAHATASELNPLDSAVILSGNGTGAAGAANKLYASEILKQPLSAELVTLSSCYGSGVRDYTGEGVVGLVWAFLRAGAHSVIGALWQVSDVATPKLMDTLYTRVLAGDTPDAALRQAKLEMLHSEGVFRKPVYWGAFQLYAGR